MTDKQKRFCEEYLIDLNATQAAIRAGYSEKTAKEIGCENLSKPNIAEYIQQLQQERSERTQITSDKVLVEVARLAFSNIANFVKVKGQALKVVDPALLPEDDSAAIASISQTANGITIKMHDKTANLDKLMRHLGMFERDNDQRKEEREQPVDWSKLSDEALREIANATKE